MPGLFNVLVDMEKRPLYTKAVHAFFQFQPSRMEKKKSVWWVKVSITPNTAMTEAHMYVSELEVSNDCRK